MNTNTGLKKEKECENLRKSIIDNLRSKSRANIITKVLKHGEEDAQKEESEEPN